jgi:fumarylacetoacetate (FAA) hydrolase family protein
MDILPQDGAAVLICRIERPSISPSVIAVRGGMLVDITSREAPTVRDVLERDDAADYVRQAPGEELGSLAEIAAAMGQGTGGLMLLTPPAISRQSRLAASHSPAPR